MNDIATTVIGGVILAIILAIFGIGGTTRVVIHGSGKVLKSGKWIMFFSVILFIYGLYLAQHPTSLGGSTVVLEEAGSILGMYSVLFFFIGKLIAWFQRN